MGFATVCTQTHSSCAVGDALLCAIDGITVCIQLAQFIPCSALTDSIDATIRNHRHQRFHGTGAAARFPAADDQFGGV